MNCETRNSPKEIIFTSLQLLLFPESLKHLRQYFARSPGSGQFFQHHAKKVSTPVRRIKADGTIMAKKKKHRSTQHPCRKHFKFRTCAVQLFVTIDPALFHISSKPSQIPFIYHNGEFRCGMTLNTRTSLTVLLYATPGLSLRR